jgi:hypothetical protein
MTACEAMIAASVAITRAGIIHCSGKSRKNGLSMALGCAMIKAPWPM